MLGGLEKFKFGNFSPTPEEEKKDPDIRKKTETANEALKKKNAEQARESLRRHLEEIPEEDREKIEKVA
jgi:DNA-binding GntR family transcriptional regulator